MAKTIEKKNAFAKPWPAKRDDLAPGAGLEILNAAICDALGRGWQPRADAERLDGDAGWRGWFTAGGKRFKILVELDYGDPRPNAVLEDALDEAREARHDQQSAEEEAEEMREDFRVAKRDLAECRADLAKIRDIVT